MKKPPQRRFKARSDTLQCRHEEILKSLHTGRLRLILASSRPACQYIHQSCKV
jgi:hypothetical protein